MTKERYKGNGAPSEAPTCRTAIYARYSSDMQSPTSADDQIYRGRSHCERGLVRLTKFAGYRIEFLPEWIVKDEAESGRIASRQGYERIREGVRTNAFDLIIVDDLSRLTRSLGSQIEFYDLLRFKGIELYSICEGISSESPSAKTFFHIKGIVNELGNDIHAQRTKRGQEARVLKGFCAGDKCYGYDTTPSTTRVSGGREVPSHYVLSINSEQAAVINYIFDMKLKGLGLAAIAAKLNKKKVPSTPRGKKITGKEVNWNTSVVRHILMREKYIGVWRWGKESRALDPESKKFVRKRQPQTHWVEHNDGKEIREDLIIVPLEKFQAVQKIIAHSTSRYKAERDKTKAMREAKEVASKNGSLLAGVLRCFQCNSPMLQVSGRKGGYYGCYSHHRKGKIVCDNRRLMNRRKVESRVTELLKEILLAPAHLEQATKLFNDIVKRRLHGAPGEIHSLQKRKTEATREISRLMNFIMRHGDTSETVKETLTQKEAEVRIIENNIRNLQAANVDKLLVTPFALKAKFQRLAEAFEKEPDLANAALRKLIPKGLKCTPAPSGKQNNNQFSSYWQIEGQVLVAPENQYFHTESMPIGVSLQL